jgi:hypothetical protein
MKYLGKTSSKNPSQYAGSGKYWKRHLHTHGYDVETQILFESNNPIEIQRMGVYYSELFNVVESDKFANLKIESGDGGWGHLTEEQIQKRYSYAREHGGTFKGRKHTEITKVKIKEARDKQKMLPMSESTKAKISNSLLGHNVSKETRGKIGNSTRGKESKLKGKSLTDSHRKNLSTAQRERFKAADGTFKGKTHTDESKQKIREARATQKNVRHIGEYQPTDEVKMKISEAHKGKVLSEETKSKISKSSKGKKKQIVVCPHCGKQGGRPAMLLWHFDKCKEK